MKTCSHKWHSNRRRMICPRALNPSLQDSIRDFQPKLFVSGQLCCSAQVFISDMTPVCKTGAICWCGREPPHLLGTSVQDIDSTDAALWCPTSGGQANLLLNQTSPRSCSAFVGLGEVFYMKRNSSYAQNRRKASPTSLLQDPSLMVLDISFLSEEHLGFQTSV